jgi:hypothetical protein
MRNPGMITNATAIVATAIALGGFAPSAAQASTTCTWGGTPAEPTGTVEFSPGITNTPASEPGRLIATGPLGGGCSGTLTFKGSAGGTCAHGTGEGIAKGLPGVARWRAEVFAGLAPALLYNKRGEVVGSENAQFVTNVAGEEDPLIACNTPEGFKRGKFSSVIELTG